MIQIGYQADQLVAGLKIADPGFGEEVGIISKVDKSKPGYVTFWVKGSSTLKYTVKFERIVICLLKPVP
jgi:hypothetical protein